MEQVFYIDLKGIDTKEALHELLAKELPLPDYYGHNLDALHDVLTEEGENWNLIFYNCEDAKPAGTTISEEFAAYMAKFRKMCAAACKECEGLRVRFF